MRKRPQQARSRQLVSALVEATAQCLAQRGLDNTTTAHIAEAAGVSVGSLYQYFDDKEALIEALLERLAEDIISGLGRIPMPDNASLRNLVEAAIGFGFATLHSRNGLYIELVRNWHRLPANRATDVLQQHFLEIARLYFARHYSEHPIDDLQVRMFIVTHSTLATMARLASQESALLPQQAVARGLVDMVTGYLTATTAGSLPS